MKDITSIGFETNPYGPCVANKLVEEKMLTIVWHFDDLKVSHCNDSVVTRMLNWLSNTYERIFPDGSGKMKISHGKVHEYLGMTLDISVPGEVKITMIPYVKGMIADFSKYDPSDKIAATPEAYPRRVGLPAKRPLA